jgi:hypothetical protein
MIRKTKVTVSPLQKLEYAKLMVEQGYTNNKSKTCLERVNLLCLDGKCSTKLN